MLVGTDVCVRMVLVWKETGVPRGNPPVWLSDQMTISHADVSYWTWASMLKLRQPDSLSTSYILCQEYISLKHTSVQN